MILIQTYVESFNSPFSFSRMLQVPAILQLWRVNKNHLQTLQRTIQISQHPPTITTIRMLALMLHSVAFQIRPWNQPIQIALISQRLSMHPCPCTTLRPHPRTPTGRRSVTRLLVIMMRQRKEQPATLRSQERSVRNIDGITVVSNHPVWPRLRNNQTILVLVYLLERPNRALTRDLGDLCHVKTSYKWLKSNSQNSIRTNNNNNMHMREMNPYIIT